MNVRSRGLIYDAAQHPPQERIAFFTSLCPLASGRILSGYQVGATKHGPASTIRLSRSTAGGAAWRELPVRFETAIDGIPGSLAAAEMVETSPGRVLLFATWFDRSDPARPLFDPVTEGLLPSKQLYAFSADEGDRWTSWRELDTCGLTGCATTGPVVAWADGTIAYAFESFKEYDDPRPARHAAWLIVSRDAGRTFSQPILSARHPRHEVFYWDQRLCPLETPGEYVALYWTHDLAERRDLTVHLRRGSIHETALDHATIYDTGLAGQIAAPLATDDGRLLAFVVDRNPPATLKLCMSADGGRTWPERGSLVVYLHDEQAQLSQGTSNIDFKKYWEDMGKWSFGHPAIRRLADGNVLLAWYAGTPDCMSIHWAKVDVD